MPDDRTRFNPFPGLRPFQAEEDHLFFGREEQTAALLTRLREHRFLAVVGASGSGKSSLVRAGLIPALHGGTMTRAGSHWEVAVFRPGGDPITNLARSLLEAGLYDAGDGEALHQLRATLTRSRFGLVEAVRQSVALDAGTNLFVLVDQFEELFRFRQRGMDHHESAAAFVKLLLTASQEEGVRIYTALTMRSDYLGDSAQIPGLAQAINRGEFLIPRLTRDQKRDAIEKPVGVGGARIAPRLAQQMLNDVGDDPDQLPILQHALMRTWEVWAGDHASDEPLDLRHYEATGGMDSALSRHADEVYSSLRDDGARVRCERIFRALTEQTTDSRGIRRPTRLGELEKVIGASRQETLAVLDAFRAPGVTFLMPGLRYPLSDRTVIDLSHESLMRVWTRLRSWVDDEAQSARVFRRLSETAALWKDGRAGLYRDPDLGIAGAWWQENRPTEAWAAQYGSGFENAVEFLGKSRDAAKAEERAREASRQRELQQAKVLADTQSRAAAVFKRFAAAVGVLAIAAGALAIWAFDLWGTAEEARQTTQDLLVESRHDQGKLWLERARRLLGEKEFLGAKLMAGKAIGFENYGRAEAGDGFQREHQILLRPDSQEWRAATGIIDFSAEFPLIWSSPLPTFATGAYYPFLNHDGSRLAVTNDSREIRLWDTRTGARLPSLSVESPVGWLGSFSDTRMLTFRRGEAGRLRDAASGRLIRELPSQVRELWIPRWEDPYHVESYLFSFKDRKLSFFSAESGEQIGVTVDVTFSDEARFAIAPDHRQGVVANAGALERFDLTGKEAIRRVGTYEGKLLALFYSADGRYLTLHRQKEGASFREADRLLVHDGESYELLYEHEAAVWASQQIAGAEISLESTEDASVSFFDLEKRTVTATYPGRVEQVSADLSHVVFSGWNSVRILDLATRRFLGDGIENAELGEVRGTRFHPSGRFFATFGTDGLKLRWTATGAVFARLEDTRAVELDFDPSGRRLVTCEREPGVVRLWDAAPLLLGSPPREVAAFPAERPIELASLDPSGETMVLVEREASPAGANDGPSQQEDPGYRIRRIDLDSGKTLWERPLDGWPAGALAFRPDGQSFTLVVRPDRLKTFHLSGEEVESQELPEWAWELAFSPNGRWLGLASRSSALLQDLDSGKRVTLPSTAARAFREVAFSPDSSLIAFGASNSGLIVLYETATQHELARIPAHADSVTSLEFSPDGRCLLSGSWDNTVKLWEVDRREVSFKPRGFAGPRIQYHPDGSRLSFGGWAGEKLTFLDVATGAEASLRLAGDSRGDGGWASFSPDGSRLLLCPLPFREPPRSLNVFAVQDGTILGPLEHEAGAKVGVFEPQGRRIATVAGNKLYLWDAQTLAPLGSHAIVREGETLEDADWSPDGRRVAAADASTVVIWSTTTGTVDRTLDAPRVAKLRFQPKRGTYLATVNSQGEVHLYEANTGAVIRRSRGLLDAPANLLGNYPILDWHPDGSALLTRRADGGLEVSEALTGEVLAYKEVGRSPSESASAWFSSSFLSAVFSPDGSRIAMTGVRGNDSVVTIWDHGRTRDPARFASYLDVYKFRESEGSRMDGAAAGASSPQTSSPPEGRTVDGAGKEAAKEESGEIVQRTSDTLYASTGFAMRPVSESSLVAILRAKTPPDETDRRLFSAYLQAGNWSSAAVTLRGLPAEGAAAERARFAASIAREATALLERTGPESGDSRERIATRWLELGEELADDDESLVALRGLLAKRREARDEALAAARHAEGLDLLEKARAYVKAGKASEAKLLAARAIGFEGLGRAESAEDFQRAHPALLRPESEERQEALDLARFEPELRVIWQTPARYRSSSSFTISRFSPDGSQIAAAGYDGTRVWSRESGELRHFFPSPRSPVFACAFHPEAARQLLATATRDGVVSVYNLASGAAVATWSAPGPRRIYSSMSFAPSGRELLVGDQDGAIHAVSAETWKEVRAYRGHTRRIADLVFRPVSSPGGDQFASASVDGTVRLWSLEPAAELRSFATDKESESWPSIAFSPDGRSLAHRGTAGISIWRVETGEELGVIESEVGPRSAGIAWSPVGAQILSVASGGRIQLWSGEGRELLHEIPGHGGTWNTLALSPDGKTLVSLTGRPNLAIRLFDVETRSRVAPPPAASHEDRVVALAASPGGDSLLSVASRGSALLWSLRGDDVAATLPTVGGDGRRSGSYTPDGAYLVLGSDQGIQVLDARSLGTVASIPGPFPLPGPGSPATGASRSAETETERGPRSSCLPLAVRPDGRRLAVGSRDGSIALLELPSLERHSTLPAAESEIADVAWHPDGARLVAHEDDGTIRILDASSGESLRSLEAGVRGGVAVSPDGRYLAVFGTSVAALRLFDFETGELRTLISLDDAAGAAAFSPDGGALAIGSSAGRLELRETRSGLRLLRSLEVSAAAIEALAFGPDGRTIAAGSVEGGVRLIEISPPLPSLLEVDDRPSEAFCFHPGGQIGYVGGGGSIREVDVATGMVVAELGGYSGALLGLGVSTDGKRLGAWSQERQTESGEPQVLARVYSTEAREKLFSHSSPGETFIPGAIDATGRRIVTAAFAARNEQQVIYFADVDERRVTGTFEVPIGTRFSLRFHPLSGEILTGDTRHIWAQDPRTGETRRRVEHGERMIFDVASSVDGSVLVARSPEALLVLDAATLETRRRVPLPGDELGTVSLSSDGALAVDAAQTSGDPLRVFSIPSGEEIDAFRDSAHSRVSRLFSKHFVPGTHRVASLGPTGDVRLRDMRSGPPDPRTWPSEWARYELEGGELVRREHTNILATQSQVLEPLGKAGILALLRNESLSDAERGKAIFAELFLARNWPAAAAVLAGLPRQETAPQRARLASALELLARSLRERQPGLADRWGRLAEGLRAAE